MLTLDKRCCWLGPDYSGKVTAEDGQTIRTLVFELQQLMLTEHELNALLGEPHAWASLYNDSPEGAVPFLKCFKSLEFNKPIEDAHVSVLFGLDTVFDFAGVQLSKIKLSLCEGGLTALSCKVRTAPTLDETLGQFFEQIGCPIDCEVVLIPPNVQQDLPLNTHGLGEQPQEPARPARRFGKTKGKGRPRKANGNRPSMQ